MRKISIRQLGLLGLALIGAGLMGGCAPSHDVYRAYYHDGNCRVFYVDMNGNRVYGYRASFDGDSYMGHKFISDGHGRWYYQDSFGNRVYRVRSCE